MVLTFGLLQLVLADLWGSYVHFNWMQFINTKTQDKQIQKREESTEKKKITH